jgi:hypothetical protein
MLAPTTRALMLALAAVLALGVLETASARERKSARAGSAEAAFWGGLVRTESGVPIIMKGYRPPPSAPLEAPPQRADRPVHIPRGSSTYIPPPVPSPYSANSPPAAALTQPAPAPYQPPRIETFGDRVTGAIHAFPLEKGLGNNPTDPQMFIRQRANQ